MPTVQFSREAIDTIWSAVWMSFGRRIRSIASISSTVSKSFIPIGVVRMRNTVSSRARVLGQSTTVPPELVCR